MIVLYAGGRAGGSPLQHIVFLHTDSLHHVGATASVARPLQHRWALSTVRTDKAVINVLELNKIPVHSDGSTEWIWGSLFDAEEEEQFDMLAKAYPEVADAVKVIKELSADQQFRYEAFLAEKAKRDWIS
ncbi:MAG: hypothetical protein LBD16_08645, partial [Oscillospiraceae bacterium]|nr:hypothetical protein [Oscillospiraceae bacterium]